MKKIFFNIIGLFAFVLSSCAAFAQDKAGKLIDGSEVNNLIDKVTAGLSQVSQAIAGAAPKAWELIVMGNWADAAVSISIAGTLFVIFLVMMTFSIIFGFKANKNDDYVPLCILSGLVAIICLFISIMNADANLAMFLQPEAVTARDLMMKAIH